MFIFNKQMTNSIDRQSILDNLTAIETTAKLLVNAFVKKNNDTELSLNGIHREELINQTTTFLSQAQKLKSIPLILESLFRLIHLRPKLISFLDETLLIANAKNI